MVCLRRQSDRHVEDVAVVRAHCHRIRDGGSGCPTGTALLICDNQTFTDATGGISSRARAEGATEARQRFDNRSPQNQTLDAQKLARGDPSNTPSGQWTYAQILDHIRTGVRPTPATPPTTRPTPAPRPTPPSSTPAPQQQVAQCETEPQNRPTQESHFDQLRCAAFFAGDSRSNPRFIPPEDRSTAGSHLGINTTESQRAMQRYTGLMGPVHMARDSASCYANYLRGALSQAGHFLRSFGSATSGLTQSCTARRVLVQGLAGSMTDGYFYASSMCTTRFERLLLENYGSYDNGGGIQRGVEMFISESIQCRMGNLNNACENSALYVDLRGRMERVYAAMVTQMERDVEGFACLNPAAKSREVCRLIGRAGFEIASLLLAGEAVRTVAEAAVLAGRGTRAQALTELLGRMAGARNTARAGGATADGVQTVTHTPPQPPPLQPSPEFERVISRTPTPAPPLQPPQPTPAFDDILRGSAHPTPMPPPEPVTAGATAPAPTARSPATPSPTVSPTAVEPPVLSRTTPTRSPVIEQVIHGEHGITRVRLSNGQVRVATPDELETIARGAVPPEHVLGTPAPPPTPNPPAPTPQAPAPLRMTPEAEAARAQPVRPVTPMEVQHLTAPEGSVLRHPRTQVIEMEGGGYRILEGATNRLRSATAEEVRLIHGNAFPANRISRFPDPEAAFTRPQSRRPRAR